MLRLFRRHWILGSLLLAGGLAVGWLGYRMHGPYRSYRVDLELVSASTDHSAPLQVGAAKQDITPDLTQYDPWVDADGNTKFEPRAGDHYEDRNGNGTFDLVWLGGFDSNRPAQGVNDPLWARAIAFRHGGVTVVMVSIDCVGLTHERFIQIRKEVARTHPGIQHIVFSSTHTHNSPDTMGIWSHHPLLSRFDERYLRRVLDRTRAAILEAVENLTPATARAAAVDLAPAGYVADSRKPEVFDRTLCVARFGTIGTDDTIATLVSWGNHPEAFGGKNPLVRSDFPHYWRKGIEEGLPGPNGIPALGGVCIYFQGPVGGLMTPLGLAVPDRNGTEIHRENGIGKVKALGENLAIQTHRALHGPQAAALSGPGIAVVARTIFAPIEGTYRIPILLGLIHPGWYGGKAKTEVNALRIGDLEIVTIPGELYPEISEGGIESPEGGDFPGAPVEVPPLRSRMRGRVNMVFNLANDEIGYIIPRSQWDTQPPYTYGLPKAPYGEVNSGGPDVAAVIHREALAVLDRLHVLLLLEARSEPAIP